MKSQESRRNLVKSAAALYTTNIFTGKVFGANGNLEVGFIGMGRMGQGNMRAAMAQDNLRIASVCDIYKPNLDKAVELSAKQSTGAARAIKDFREVLADKSIDAVCISTPDHWHPYMAIEACKAGKDVYVEKPISVTIEEGQKMVQAARKYKRVVQAGTMQRSGKHFIDACELVRQGRIGEVTVVKTWNYGNGRVEGIGSPADGAPPSDLDWDMWLGPAPNRPFNANRFGVDPKAFSHFRWFWDYAGGMMTDWGVHVLDIARMGMAEPMPRSCSAFGQKFLVQDNRETPDTLSAIYEFPKFIAHYENRMFNSNSMFKQGYGTMFHGTKGTMFVDRSLYRIHPESSGPNVPPAEVVEVKSSNNSNNAHWANFVDCIKSRQRPASDIEICYKSTVTCLLANISILSKQRVDWDESNDTIAQPSLRKFMRREERSPWKLKV
ncbi:MAG: Gfo/Idh/MocA family oxidoreductase [Acidobacteria bacterium]|nr:Gfo/Idh/MocA family oxidoreductase [Acidobacteriota bacterium]